MRQLAALALTLTVAASWGVASVSAQVPSGALRPRVPRGGTSVITGRVLTSDTLAPVRGADVMATSANGSISVATTSDSEGAYRFERLPAGDWHIAASKPGFVTWEVGQRRPFEKVPPLVVARGQEVTANIPLTRGGAISGQVSDQTGEPIAGLEVRVYRARMERGARRLQAVGLADLTDDRGAFRVYGLPPGDYYVAASLRLAPVDSVVEITYSPTYYPGTGNLAEAQRLRLGLGSELSVTFPLLPVRASRVSGFVMSSSGSAGDAYLNLESEASELGVPLGFGAVTRPDGSFSINDVAPGRYRLTATLRGDGPEESGSTLVTVVDDVSGITVAMGRHARLLGVIVAADDASGRLPANLEVSAIAARGAGTVLGADTGLHFDIPTISEPFRLVVDGLADRWVVKQVTVNGIDTTDSVAEIAPGQEAEARIVVTNRITEVTGTVTGGDTAADWSVVIFPEDSTKWGPRSRYLRMTQADARGTFRVTGLPPDERYLVVATDYLEEGEHTDPDFFTAMRGLAVPFSLAEGETRQVDLRVVAR